jgi:hypothetical protein
VQAWLRSRFKLWTRTKPEWFTAGLLASIHIDMLLPRDARRLAKAQGGSYTTIHAADASLVQRLSLGVPSVVEPTPAVARSQVTPQVAAEAAGASDSESSDSGTESDSERQPPPDPGADTAGPVPCDASNFGSLAKLELEGAATGSGRRDPTPADGRS